MGTADYRVAVGWRTHPKRKLLKGMLGPSAVLAVMDLWEFCATSRTTGDLSGMTAEEIALAADYDGNATEWLNALLSLRLVDPSDAGGVRIHDWAKINPYVAGQTGRSERARRASSKRWGEGDDGRGTPDAESGSSNAPYPDPTPYPVPSPTPSPQPIPKPAPPDTAGALVELFPALGPDVDRYLLIWRKAFPELDLVRVASMALSDLATHGETVRAPGPFLAGCFKKAAKDAADAQRTASAQHEAEHAKRKAAELEEARRERAAREAAERGAQPIGADIRRLFDAVKGTGT